jgi:hypothetical protein
MVKPDAVYRSWHWPSSISPMVDAKLLAEIASRENPDYFRREFLAEWVDGAGTYFSPAELDDRVRDDVLCEPKDAHGRWAVAGVDWGLARDASTLAVVSLLPDQWDGWRYGVTWLEEHFGKPYHEFIDLVAGTASGRGLWGGGYRYERVASECNGVGQMPSEELARRMPAVLPVFTDARLKQDAFGALKSLLQQELLFLPRHPELLKQLAALEYTITESGSLRLSVPDRVGHDDLAMACALAVHAWRAPRPLLSMGAAAGLGRARWSYGSGRR